MRKYFSDTPSYLELWYVFRLLARIWTYDPQQMQTLPTVMYLSGCFLTSANKFEQESATYLI